MDCLGSPWPVLNLSALCFAARGDMITRTLGVVRVERSTFQTAKRTSNGRKKWGLGHSRPEHVSEAERQNFQIVTQLHSPDSRSPLRSRSNDLSRSA